MNVSYTWLLTALLLAPALGSQGQPPKRVRAYNRPVYVEKQPTVKVRDSVHYYRRPVRSFLDRFQPDSLNYEAQYTAIQDEEQRKRCEPMLAARQQVVNQLARIEELLRETRYGLLSQEKQAGSLPIIDSLYLRKGQPLFLHIRYFLTVRGVCNIDKIDHTLYPTLITLQQQKRVVINGFFSSTHAVTIGALPMVTGNTQEDAANYLAKIKDLLVRNFNQLRTSFPQYQNYESQKQLTTDVDKLKFRRTFCYGILCNLSSK